MAYSAWQASRATQQAGPDAEAVGLLTEARKRLPMAAACWNEEREKYAHQIDACMDLIARIDAYLARQKL